MLVGFEEGERRKYCVGEEDVGWSDTDPPNCPGDGVTGVGVGVEVIL